MHNLESNQPKPCLLIPETKCMFFRFCRKFYRFEPKKS